MIRSVHHPSSNSLQQPSGPEMYRLRAYVFASHSSESRFFAGRERASAPSWHSTRESYWWPSYGSSQTQLQTVNGFLLLSCTSHAKPVAEGTLVSTRGEATYNGVFRGIIVASYASRLVCYPQRHDFPAIQVFHNTGAHTHRITGPRYNLHPSTEAHAKITAMLSSRQA